MFFVATAPLSGDGMVNCSPKGGDTLRVVDDHTLAYLEFTGSGIETVAHLRENGRIVVMLFAFEGPSRIYRFHGTGDAVTPAHSDFNGLAALFDQDLAGVRSIIRVKVNRISDSCGFSVPRYDYVEDRNGLRKWTESQGTEGIRAYVAEKNLESIDGLPALTEEEAETVSPGQ